MFPRRRGSPLLGGGNPASVGVEQEEENDAEGHEVHVNQEENSAVVEAPTSLHATDGVGSAGYCDECGEDEERSGVVAREVGEDDSYCQTGKDEETTA